MGGYKTCILEIKGEYVYSKLKYEVSNIRKIAGRWNLNQMLQHFSFFLLFAYFIEIFTTIRLQRSKKIKQDEM